MSYYDVIRKKSELREFLENLYFHLRAVLKNLPKPTVEKYRKKILQSLNGPLFDVETRMRILSEFLK